MTQQTPHDITILKYFYETFDYVFATIVNRFEHSSISLKNYI